LRLIRKPDRVFAPDEEIKQTEEHTGKGWTWTPLLSGGILRVNHEHSNEISILIKFKGIQLLTSGIFIFLHLNL